MTEYEFQCQVCQQVFSVLRNPHKSKVALHCGKKAERLYGLSGFRVSQPNGPDDINLGLGRHFKSNRERDYFADSHDCKRVKDG